MLVNQILMSKFFSYPPPLQVDAHRDRVRGVLLREAWPARHLPQSGKDSRLDIALGELSIDKSDLHHDDCAKQREICMQCVCCSQWP